MPVYPPPLSEKAKGKQRAVDPPPATDQLTSHSPLPEATSRDLVVRFTEGAPDLTISLDKADSVREVKKRIRSARPTLQNRRLRLIHAGRLLTDGTSLFAWLAALEERQQRATSAEAGPPRGSGVDGAPTPVPTPVDDAGTTWVHCSVGPVMDPGELEEDTAEQTGQLQPARGFDRLAALGFSADDIENFRQQFHSQSYSNYLDIDVAEEEYDEHARSLEEQWIDNLDGAAPTGLTQSGPTATATLQGVLLGFFFPLLPFFFMRVHRPAIFWADDSGQPPTSLSVFPRPVSAGIIIGLLVNILFGIWRFLLDSA